MRPIQLIFQAFGPYADRQTLDFRKLDGRALFLIHGPTGAGKTTILDAMCYALYGKTSGGEREGKLMRSDHADASLPTEVTFDFALGGECYRVTRRPEQERPKLRGSGTKLDNATATLWRRTACVTDSEEGTVLESQASRVDAAVTDLLGFRIEQFRQVVMLPQGRFRELLLSDSRDRQTILQSLFQTYLYANIEEALKRKAKAIADERNTYTIQRRILLDQAGVATPEALDKRIIEAEAERAQTQNRVREVSQAESLATIALNDGKAVVEKINEQIQASLALECLLQRQEEITKKRQRVQFAQKARPLAEAERSLRERQRESEDAIRRVRDAEYSLGAAETSLNKSSEALLQERQRDEERDRTRQDLLHLQGLSGKVDELADARKSLLSAESEAQRSHQLLDMAKSDVEVLECATSECTQAKVTAEQVFSRQEIACLSVRELREDAEQWDNFARLQGEQRSLTTELASLQQQLGAIEEQRASLRAQASQAQQAWDNGQAAILAHTLQPDKPCPVCGSIHHPAPAAATADLPSETTVKQLRAKVEHLENERNCLRELCAVTAQRLDSLSSQTTSCAKYFDTRGVTDRNQLMSQLQQAEIELAQATAAGEQLQQLSEELERLSCRLADLRQQVQSIEENAKSAEQSVAQARVVVNEREHGIPDELRDATNLAKTISNAEQRLNILTEALERAQADEQRARQQLVAWQATLASAQERQCEICDRLLTQQREFTASVKAAGFTDEIMYRTAQTDIAIIESLDEEIRQYEGDLRAATDRSQRAMLAASGLSMPDLAQLKIAASQAHEAYEAILHDDARIQSTINELQRVRRDLQNVDEQAADLDAQYAIYGQISEVANGQNGKRITFQRYVLGALLDDVLLVASRRLHLMSKGRFTLSRAIDHRDMRTAAGLELEVMDTYTDKRRPVSTLSGGESFLASLSLALGLADVVQTYAGGIRLETIFVDEGFGSLDPEALDLAFRTLLDLQTEGRLVGIISHVPELKERIDIRLEVTADARGSQARFVFA